MTIFGVATIVLFILKVTGVLAISWWTVLLPSFIGLLINLVVYAIFVR